MLIITALLYSAIYNKGGTREGARLMKGMLSPTKGYKLIVLPPPPHHLLQNNYFLLL